VLLTPRVEDRHSIRHQQRGERDVLGHDEISRRCMRRDVLVGHIGPAVHPHGAHERVAGRGLEPLIRDQQRLDAQSPGGPEDQLLHVPRRGVRVDPDLHGARPAVGATATSCQHGFDIAEPSPS
jgi:hypothetical protein